MCVCICVEDFIFKYINYLYYFIWRHTIFLKLLAKVYFLIAYFINNDCQVLKSDVEHISGCCYENLLGSSITVL